jgi:hypothetical protein
VRSSRRCVSGRPGYLLSQRGRGLDDADEELLREALLSFEDQSRPVGARRSPLVGRAGPGQNVFDNSYKMRPDLAVR